MTMTSTHGHGHDSNGISGSGSGSHNNSNNNSSRSKGMILVITHDYSKTASTLSGGKVPNYYMPLITTWAINRVTGWCCDLSLFASIDELINGKGTTIQWCALPPLPLPPPATAVAASKMKPSPAYYLKCLTLPSHCLL
jgi:hypothetical protein